MFGVNLYFGFRERKSHKSPENPLELTGNVRFIDSQYSIDFKQRNLLEIVM